MTSGYGNVKSASIEKKCHLLYSTGARSQMEALCLPARVGRLDDSGRWLPVRTWECQPNRRILLQTRHTSDGDGRSSRHGTLTPTPTGYQRSSLSAVLVRTLFAGVLRPPPSKPTPRPLMPAGARHRVLHARRRPTARVFWCGR